jgi:hypothetical protein
MAERQRSGKRVSMTTSPKRWPALRSSVRIVWQRERWAAHTIAASKIDSWAVAASCSASHRAPAIGVRDGEVGYGANGSAGVGAVHAELAHAHRVELEQDLRADHDRRGRRRGRA